MYAVSAVSVVWRMIWLNASQRLKKKKSLHIFFQSILQSIILMPSQSRAAAPQRLRVVAAHLSARTVASGDAGNLVVLITGVTSGLGRALCEEFAARNHIIVGCGRREDRLAELRATMPSNCLFSAVDTTHASEVATWAYHVHRKYPK